MQAITLLIASIASILILFLSPIYGLIVYIASFAWYPTYLTVPVGTIDFTVRRIVILVILAKLFLLTDLPKRFKFTTLDKCIIIYFSAVFFAEIMASSSKFMEFLEYFSGRFLDTFLPYFTVRMILQNRQQYLTLLKWILIMAVPIAIVGFFECLTGTNLVGFFEKYNAWGTLSGIPLENRYWIRSGFFRANTVFSHPIMHGLFFAMFGPICAGLMRSVKRHKNLCIIGLIFMVLGVFSSMSSGSFLALFLAVLFIVSYRWRKYWKPVVISIIVMCGLVEIISNNPFVLVVSNAFVFNSANAWYRSRLMEIALFEGGMSGHWLIGFPFGAEPGWGAKINLLSYTDMANHHLLILFNHGLIGFVPFVALIVVAIKNLNNAYKASIFDSDKWLIWCMSGALFGILLAMFSTSLFGPPLTVYYIMIAFAGVMPTIVVKENYLHSMRTKTGLLHNGKFSSELTML